MMEVRICQRNLPHATLNNLISTEYHSFVIELSVTCLSWQILTGVIIVLGASHSKLRMICCSKARKMEDEDFERVVHLIQYGT